MGIPERHAMNPHFTFTAAYEENIPEANLYPLPRSSHVDVVRLVEDRVARVLLKKMMYWLRYMYSASDR